MSRTTLAASLVRVGQAVQPIINLLRDHLLEADLILGDETVVQVLKESGRAAQTKSYLWAQMTGSGPPIRLFSYTPGRSGQHAQPLLRRSRSRHPQSRTWTGITGDTVYCGHWRVVCH